MAFKHLKKFHRRSLNLAAKLALKKAPESLSMLKALADEAFDLAAAEDRDRSPIRMVPRFTDYR